METHRLHSLKTKDIEVSEISEDGLLRLLEILARNERDGEERARRLSSAKLSSRRVNRDKPGR